LHAAGAAAVLLTRGADGAVVADRFGVHELPAVPAEVLDVTGAGDALVAGTLAALIGTDFPADRGADGTDSASSDLLDAVRSGIRLAARTVASARSVLPYPLPAQNL
jgi:pseudouridine kinase